MNENERSIDKKHRYSRENYDNYMQGASNTNINNNEINQNGEIYNHN